MRYAVHIICLITVMALGGCAKICNWFHKQDMAVEEDFAAHEVPEPAHPVGVIYDVESTVGPAKQTCIFFSGEGMARLLEPDSNKDIKTLVDFGKQEIVSKDFKTNWLQAKKIDPFSFPSVLNAKEAKQQNAICLGTGATRGFPYHRWCLRKNVDEWEVWTDDRDSFPIYFRAIKNGEVCTWTIGSSWIDGSTYDKKTFFKLEADPPPPEPIKTEAELNNEAPAAEIKPHQRHGHPHKHGRKLKSNKEASG